MFSSFIAFNNKDFAMKRLLVLFFAVLPFFGNCGEISDDELIAFTKNEPYLECISSNKAKENEICLDAITKCENKYAYKTSLVKSLDDFGILISEFEKCIKNESNNEAIAFYMMENSKKETISFNDFYKMYSYRGIGINKKEDNIFLSAITSISYAILFIVSGGLIDSNNNVSFGNAIYINPYTKKDGTRVKGHYRTKPNNTCIDNIRGCR